MTPEHIPSESDIHKWPYLQSIPIQNEDVEIGLTIGSNVPDAFSALGFRTGPQGSPHATRT